MEKLLEIDESLNEEKELVLNCDTDEKEEINSGKFKACYINSQKIHRTGHFIYGFSTGRVIGINQSRKQI